MLSSIFPLLYGTIVLFLLWQAVRLMAPGFKLSEFSNQDKLKSQKLKGDRTGRLTIHPELLDQEGRITDEELLTVRFSGDNESPPTSESSSE